MEKLSHKTIKGVLEVVTGLHIGAGNEKLEIGGVDNPIIKHPITRLPYIPGSSIKGKMRSLLEWDFGLVEKDKGTVHKCDNESCHICRLFGNSSQKSEQGPTRLIARDAFLTQEYIDKIKEGIEITEIKKENTIDRITAIANPRDMERISPGVCFDFELVLRIFDPVADQSCINTLKRGLSLLEKDYLGGSGSRGYGKIRFKDLKINDESFCLTETP